MSDEEAVDFMELMLDHDPDEEFCPVNIAASPEAEKYESVDFSMLPCMCVLISSVRLDQTIFIVKVLHKSAIDMVEAGDLHAAMVLHTTAVAIGDLATDTDEETTE